MRQGVDESGGFQGGSDRKKDVSMSSVGKPGVLNDNGNFNM